MNCWTTAGFTLRAEIGPSMFEHACKLGLEGIVSKHRDRAYRAGRSANWIKIKNPASPAMLRLRMANGGDRSGISLICRAAVP